MSGTRDGLVCLLRAASPRRRGHRPCASCPRPCECPKGRGCRCACNASCADAPVRLLGDPSHPSLPAAMVPLVFALASIEGMNPTRVGPAVERVAEGRPYLAFEPDSGVLAELLACRLEALSAKGRLHGRWQIALRAEGAFRASVVLEPEALLDPRAAESDLSTLGLDLPRSLPAMARERLVRGLREAGVDDSVLSGLFELTAREREVLGGFLAGASVDSLAARFHLSLHTVRNHLKHIGQKLGVTSQVALRELFAALR